MTEILFTIIIGLIAGTIDILPMIKMKLDKHDLLSAFVFYFIMPFIIFNTELFGMAWWIKGGIITLVLAAPIIILNAKTDKKSVPIMILMNVILGTLISVAGYFFI